MMRYVNAQLWAISVALGPLLNYAAMSSNDFSPDDVWQQSNNQQVQQGGSPVDPNRVTQELKNLRQDCLLLWQLQFRAMDQKRECRIIKSTIKDQSRREIFAAPPMAFVFYTYPVLGDYRRKSQEAVLTKVSKRFATALVSDLKKELPRLDQHGPYYSQIEGLVQIYKNPKPEAHIYLNNARLVLADLSQACNQRYRRLQASAAPALAEMESGNEGDNTF